MRLQTQRAEEKCDQCSNSTGCLMFIHFLFTFSSVTNSKSSRVQEWSGGGHAALGVMNALLMGSEQLGSAGVSAGRMTATVHRPPNPITSYRHLDLYVHTPGILFVWTVLLFITHSFCTILVTMLQQHCMFYS